MNTTTMTRAQARKATDAAKAYRAAGDQRWTENLHTVIARKGHIALGYDSQGAYGETEFGLAKHRVTAHSRVGRARLALKSAGVRVPTRGVSVENLRRLSHRDLDAVVALVQSGADLDDAMRTARSGDDYGLFDTPTEPRDLGTEFHPNVVALAQVIEAIGFSTPVRDLLDAEAVLVACLDGLTSAVEALSRIPQTPTNNSTKEK